MNCSLFNYRSTTIMLSSLCVCRDGIVALVQGGVAILYRHYQNGLPLCVTPSRSKSSVCTSGDPTIIGGCGMTDTLGMFSGWRSSKGL